MKPFEFVSFKESDIATLTPVMKRAFGADAQFYLGRDGGPPGFDHRRRQPGGGATLRVDKLL